MIPTEKMFGYCGVLRAVILFVSRSAMFVKAVFKHDLRDIFAFGDRVIITEARKVKI